MLFHGALLRLQLVVLRLEFVCRVFERGGLFGEPAIGLRNGLGHRAHAHGGRAQHDQDEQQHHDDDTAEHDALVALQGVCALLGPLHFVGDDRIDEGDEFIELQHQGRDFRLAQLAAGAVEAFGDQRVPCAEQGVRRAVHAGQIRDQRWSYRQRAIRGAT